MDPELRAAVAAALADRARAYLVGAAAVGALAGERGRLIVEERLAIVERVPAADPATSRCLDAVVAAGGGRLVDAIRRDVTGGVRRLLARTVWLPDLAACLAIQALLPAGWLAVPRDGSAVVDDVGVALGAADTVLERRAEQQRLATDLERADDDLATLRAVAATTTSAAERARGDHELARADEARLAAEHRRAEEVERAAARDAEAIAREVAWHEAQRSRLAAEVTRLAEAVASNSPTAEPAGPGDPQLVTDDERSAVAVWEARAAELRDRRDRLASRLATHEAGRRDAEHQVARAEAAAAMAEDRVARAEREAATLADGDLVLSAERDSLRAEMAAAATAEAQARDALVALQTADAIDRARLSDGERAATGARDRLRSADDRLRAADHTQIEARVGLESLREGVLAELAGMGELGSRSLGVSPDPADDAIWTGVQDDRVMADDTVALEAALAVVAEGWTAAPPTVPAPTPGRLAQLRRRYHELGATNPYAVDEYAELRVRLETLETQGADLLSAIARTRELIAELESMIATQFRATFEALEGAFERRFEQLFGGGFARLALTDPTDLGSTGIEIVARPPGKKPQALAMLSGGERALTAVALLFAMLEVRPVPFCVLDEVDAALDEANIGRFADALRSLAHQTQFIVITHNRGTIEAADALYG
ncbi:MAG: hypothetical protein M3Q66_07640, partial [Chloroflexota bacterium]|nr:hypothetical protein [Chloroflexota bacterium]